MRDSLIRRQRRLVSIVHEMWTTESRCSWLLINPLLPSEYVNPVHTNLLPVSLRGGRVLSLARLPLPAGGKGSTDILISR